MINKKRRGETLEDKEEAEGIMKTTDDEIDKGERAAETKRLQGKGTKEDEG